jgi:phage protein D/phage baseplate assembly protein gpV
VTSLATAAVTITLDGQRLREPERLGSVRVASRLSQPAQCELALQLGHGRHGWPEQWALGAHLSVRVTGDPGELFAGEVTAVELRHRGDGAAELRVRAYDLLHRLRRRQRLRVFEEVTAADVVAALITDLPLDLVVDEPGPRLDRVVQHQQSDFELLQEVTREAGLLTVVRDGELRLLTRAGYGDPVEVRQGSSLWDLRVEANLDRVARRVTAIGWHNQYAEVLSRPATSPRRAAVPVDPDPRRAGVDGERTLVNRSVRSGDHLAAIAQADLDASAGRAVTVEGVTDGDGRLWAGRRIAVTGLPAPPAGEYVPASVIHTVDAAGYQTIFSTELPELPELPDLPAQPGAGMRPAGGTTVTLGQVTSVADPEDLARVRVSLPAYGGLDAGWLPLLHPGAGRDRGLVIVPDVGDTVAVALPQHAPADGLVLGSLYGAVRPPDDGVVGGAVRRWSMRTPAGQSIVIDDSERVVRVQNQAGSYVELGPDRMRLHATTDLVIEAPGSGITVRARSVDFERAG